MSINDRVYDLLMTMPYLSKDEIEAILINEGYVFPKGWVLV